MKSEIIGKSKKKKRNGKTGSGRKELEAKADPSLPKKRLPKMGW